MLSYKNEYKFDKKEIFGLFFKTKAQKKSPGNVGALYLVLSYV